MVGCGQIIEFQSNGKSQTYTDPYDIVFEKIKTLLGCRPKEQMANPTYGVSNQTHRLNNSLNRTILKKYATIALQNEMPYVVVEEIKDYQYKNNISYYILIISINKEKFELPITS